MTQRPVQPRGVLAPARGPRRAGLRGGRCRRSATARCSPGPSSRQPVVHDVPVFAAAATDCFLVRSTAPAATTCRYSTVRESSSTLPAKSAAARKPHKPASSAAVALTSRSAARARSTPDARAGHPTRIRAGTCGRVCDGTSAAACSPAGAPVRALPRVLERNEIPAGFHDPILFRGSDNFRSPWLRIRGRYWNSCAPPRRLMMRRPRGQGCARCPEGISGGDAR